MSRLLIGKGGLFCEFRRYYGTCYNIHRERVYYSVGRRRLRHMLQYSSENSCPSLRNKKMNWHFVFPRVATAYTWSRKVPHFSVSQSDCECFPIEYCTLCLSTPRGRLCTVSATFEFHDCPLVDLSKSGGAVTAE